LFSRFTHGRILKLLQTKGAKMHFNDVKIPIDEYVEMLEDNSIQEDGLKDIHFRYGIIHINDMKRDLKYWETLLTSSMM
jgi:hypothetical protein